MIQINLIVALLLIINSSLCSNKNNTTKELTMQVRLGNTNINYTTMGKGDTTLLFIHGWCINSSYWIKQQEFFSTKYKSIAVDLPGFAKSTAQRDNWTIEEYSKDIIHFIDHLKLSNVILIGHSMAGEIILECALTNHPSIKGIVGIDNFKMIDVQFSAEQYEEMNGFIKMLKNDFRNMAPAYAEQMLLNSTTPESVTKRVKSDFAGADEQVGFSSLSNLIQYTINEKKKLQNLNYKLYLLNSNVIPTNIPGLENNCKNSFEVIEINATSHYPMIENPEGFNILLQKTITKI